MSKRIFFLVAAPSLESIYDSRLRFSLSLVSQVICVNLLKLFLVFAAAAAEAQVGSSKASDERSILSFLLNFKLFSLCL